MEGLYQPSEQETVNCVFGNKACEYGICSECTLYQGMNEFNKEVDEIVYGKEL